MIIDKPAMISFLLRKYRESSEEQQTEFARCTREKLVLYHYTLGRMIRNEFKLWEHEWKPELVNGVDVSPDHPDQISMEVITKLWEFLNDIDQANY